MYGEQFDIPAPDELVFVSSFAGGEVFRSGCCWTRGKGRVFYFSPGDQEYPVYHHPDVQRVLANAVRWAAPAAGRGCAAHPGPRARPRANNALRPPRRPKRAGAETRGPAGRTGVGVSA